MADTTQFIWLYVSDEARGDELRYSIRSVYKHFCGKPHITVVGDRPDWYTGHYIDVPKITDCAWPKFLSPLDQSHKVNTLLQRADVDETFVLMMDDHYFLRGVLLDTLTKPRIAPKWHPDTRYWWDLSITLTMQILERRGLSTHQYETHLMHVFEKEKLKYIVDTFNLTAYPALRNTLYGNMFRKNPQVCTSYVEAIQHNRSHSQLNIIAKRATVLNHADYVWSPSLRDWLISRFPEPSEVETHVAVPEQSVVSV